MAAALLAYEAKVVTSQRQGLGIEQLLGDGSNGAADHALRAGEMIEAIELAPPLAGERAAYKRAIGRAYAEWPLVELVARVVVERGASSCASCGRRCRAVPVRLAEAEESARRACSASTIAVAAQAATVGAKPLPMTGYKLDLLAGLIQDLLEQCTAGSGASQLRVGKRRMATLTPMWRCWTSLCLPNLAGDFAGLRIPNGDADFR